MYIVGRGRYASQTYPSPPSNGGGGGGGAGSNVFTYDQGSPDNPSRNFYGSWPNLITAIQGVQSPVIWYTKNSTIPAGVWNMNRGTILSNILLGNPTPYFLTADDGTTLVDLYSIDYGTILQFQNTAVPGLTWTPGFGSVPFLSIGLTGGTGELQNAGTVPIISVPAAGFFVLFCGYGAAVSVPGSPALDIAAGGFVYVFTNLRCNLTSDWVSGAGFLVYVGAPDFIPPPSAPFIGIQFTQGSNLYTIDGGSTTPGHSFVMDPTSGFFRDGVTGEPGVSKSGVMSQEWDVQPAVGSIWTFNQTEGGLRLRTDGGIDVLSVASSGEFSVQNVNDLSVNGSKWFQGAGSPEGTIVGSPGDFYSNTAGGAGSSLWTKISGVSTNTGWAALDNAPDTAYTPSTPGDWAGSPTNVQDAIDRLAAAVSGLLGAPIP